ncbi:MAG: DNA-binding response regulator [Rhodobiaceae bacterium]|nr:DNA-binding response regulator [Rhodobiaceae bacterium]
MLLLVDDDADIRESLSEYLEAKGFEVVAAENAESARAAILANEFDLIILDIMMPGEDGLSLCRQISAHNKTPIILLSALNEEMDRIVGLEVGADDYLAKPFNPRELLARIRAILRRGTGRPETRRVNKAYRFRGYTFDGSLHQLTDPKGEVTELTGSEAKLMQLLLEAENRVLSRDFLLEQISGRQSDAFDRSIDNQISRLRKKIEKNPAKPEFIKTVRGGGYRFTIATTQDGDTG